MEEIIAFIASLTLHTLIPCILILAGGIYAILLIMKLFDKALAKSKLEKAVHPLLRTLLKILLFLLLGFIVASKLGVDVSGIIAVVSLASLAVSLAVQDALTNVVGGFTLMSTHPFHAGDYVEVAGQSGVVQEIGITYTRLSTPDNKLISIPNSTVTASQIVNYSAIGTRRVDISVSASYDADTELVLNVLKQAADLPQTLPDPAVFTAITEYGQSAISYALRFYVRSEDYWDAYFGAQKRIKAVFDANGIAMSYPHINVHLDK